MCSNNLTMTAGELCPVFLVEPVTSCVMDCVFDMHSLISSLIYMSRELCVLSRCFRCMRLYCDLLNGCFFSAPSEHW